MTVSFGEKIGFVQAVEKMMLEMVSELDVKAEKLGSTALSRGRASRKVNELTKEFYERFQKKIKKKYPDKSYKNLVDIAVIDSSYSFYGGELKNRLMAIVLKKS